MSRFRTPGWRLHRRARRERGGPPNRSGAVVGLALAATFAVLGVWLVLPRNRAFGLVWTALAIALAIGSAVRLVRLVRDRGAAG